MSRALIIGLLALLMARSHAAAQGCTEGPVAVQVLGSGGPRINPFRSSASYLLWIDNQSKILVDVGGGAFHRFGQSQARLSDLAMLAISHLHPDHVSDLPALLWLSHNDRKERLPIVGPSGNEEVPEFSVFLHRLFDEKTGAFQLLGPVLGAKQGPLGGGVPLDVTVVDVARPEASTVFEGHGITVSAMGIPHGNVPTLAYRVTTKGVSVVFSSDQTGTNPNFVPFAKGANVLVMHLAIGSGATSRLHAPPDVVGRVAKEAGVGQLLLSHIGLFSLDPAIAEVKKSYDGPLTVVADLQCTTVR